MGMDLRKLKTILELFEKSDIDEMEISEGEERLRLAKRQTGSPASAQQVAAPMPAPAPQAQPAPAAAEPAAEEDDGLVHLEAPMVGTFYSRPSEDEKPFIAVGDKVMEGDTVCIIEAMKLFNNVKAPVSGKVVRIHVDNEQPVGYGDVLISFEPDS